MKRLLTLLTLSCFSLTALANVVSHFETIKASPNALYAFLKDMPKGGELHYHLAGSVYPETMLAFAKTKSFCMITQKHEAIYNNTCDYIPSIKLAQKPKVYDEFVRAWSMKDFIPGKQSAHDHFFEVFYKIGEVVSAFRTESLVDIINRAANQNELYLEIMDIPDDAKAMSFAKLLSKKHSLKAKYSALLKNKAYRNNITFTVNQAQHILGETRKLMHCDKTPNSKACQVEVRLQYFIMRNLPLDSVFASAVNAFASADRSNSIVGINMVQEEDGYYTLKDYTKQMQMIAFLHKKYPKVHISLHAGELAPAAVPPYDLRFHIDQAVNIAAAERIGHGVDIGYENNADKLVEQMAMRQIPVEINLTSNQWILNVTGKQHPLDYYLAHKVPVVLSTDDEGILRTDLTRQYVKAVLEHGMSYAQLKQASRNALSYSFLPGASLWQNNATSEAVSQCSDINSKECEQFAQNSAKARLQLKLEQRFKAFEDKFVTN